MVDPGSADLPFEVETPLRVLTEHGADFVVVGGIAGIVHGSAFPTFDLDIAYSRDDANLERLAAALKELGAKSIFFYLDVQLDAETLGKESALACNSPYGSITVFGDVRGIDYEELRKEAPIETIEGTEVRVASLDHLIAMRRSSDRIKDKLMVEEYIVLADEQRRRA